MQKVQPELNSWKCITFSKMAYFVGQYVPQCFKNSPQAGFARSVGSGHLVEDPVEASPPHGAVLLPSFWPGAWLCRAAHNTTQHNTAQHNNNRTQQQQQHIITATQHLPVGALQQEPADADPGGLRSVHHRALTRLVVH